MHDPAESLDMVHGLLSYRHSSHAGNFGDVIKHIVLVEILEYLTQQIQAFEYVDTHAGAGLYRLDSEYEDKPLPSSKAITRLNSETWPELASYFDTVHSFNMAGSLDYYPGSPLIAKHLMRSQDRAWLYEINPVEFQLLQDNISEQDKRVRLSLEDGFENLPGLLPPTSGSGLILVDPPYEDEADYDRVFTTLHDAHRKFATGIYALWYPVVDRQRIVRLQDRFINSGIRDIQQFELGLKVDSSNKDMTSSGMIVINPPCELMSKMRLLLPCLVDTLAMDSSAFSMCDVLVDK